MPRPAPLALTALLGLLAQTGRADPGASAEPGAGFTLAVDTRAAAYHVRGAPTAIVHAPPGFDARAPLHLVVFLHGFNGCTQVLARGGRVSCREGEPERDGWDLARHHDAAAKNTLFVIPQLAFMRRDGRPGCFGQRGCFRRFLEELLGETLAKQLGGPRTLRDVESLDLVAHSGGYHTALAILEQGEVAERVRAVILLDALYGYSARFARWLERAEGRARLVSVYIGRGKTYRESRLLFTRGRRALGPAHVAQLRSRGAEGAPRGLAQALATKQLIIANSFAEHAGLPAAQLAGILAALPLPDRRQ
jgi:hypothetical protein